VSEIQEDFNHHFILFQSLKPDVTFKITIEFVMNHY